MSLQHCVLLHFACAEVQIKAVGEGVRGSGNTGLVTCELDLFG